MGENAKKCSTFGPMGGPLHMSHPVNNTFRFIFSCHLCKKKKFTNDILSSIYTIEFWQGKDEIIGSGATKEVFQANLLFHLTRLSVILSVAFQPLRFVASEFHPINSLESGQD